MGLADLLFKVNKHPHWFKPSTLRQIHPDPYAKALLALTGVACVFWLSQSLSAQAARRVQISEGAVRQRSKRQGTRVLLL